MNAELVKNLVQRVAVGDIFRRKAQTMPDKEAVAEKRGETYLRLTYGELNAQLNRFARALRTLGLQKGDRVGLLGPNSLEYLIALYGCAKGGFVAVPINPGLAPRDVAYILNHAEVKILIVDDLLCALVNGIKGNIPGVEHFISIPAAKKEVAEPFVDFYRFMQDCSGEEVEDVVIQDRDLFEILYTSGTTALPKGVMISHLSVFIMSLTNAIELGIIRGSVGTTLMPLFHCAQQTFTTTFFHIGGKNVLFRGFDPAATLEAIERERIDVIFCLPGMYRTMLDHPGIKKHDLSSVRSCVYAMTPMDRKTLEEGIKVFGADFMLGTGQTEFFPSTNAFRAEWQLKKRGNYWGESALTVDTAVMDEEGNLLPPGQTGEIVWRGPAAMEGYLKNPEATGESRKFGWHHSGDLGYFDEDRLLVFVDRKKDMIKTGGENVPSVKVEQVLLSHPRIESAAVVGLPHERWSEAVTAFVVPKKGTQLTEEDVIAFCKKELGGFEVPKRVMLLEELPKTATGKVQKHVLRERYQELYK
jgi:long-chain acyl-CoA synthetase